MTKCEDHKNNGQIKWFSNYSKFICLVLSSTCVVFTQYEKIDDSFITNITSDNHQNDVGIRIISKFWKKVDVGENPVYPVPAGFLDKYKTDTKSVPKTISKTDLTLQVTATEPEPVALTIGW